MKGNGIIAMTKLRYSYLSPLYNFFRQEKEEKLILYKALKRDYSSLKNASGKHN